MPSIEKSIAEIKDTSKPDKAVGDAPKFSTMKLVFIVNVVVFIIVIVIVIIIVNII